MTLLKNNIGESLGIIGDHELLMQYALLNPRKS